MFPNINLAMQFLGIMLFSYVSDFQVDKGDTYNILTVEGFDSTYKCDIIFSSLDCLHHILSYFHVTVQLELNASPRRILN